MRFVPDVAPLEVHDEWCRSFFAKASTVWGFPAYSIKARAYKKLYKRCPSWPLMDPDSVLAHVLVVDIGLGVSTRTMIETIRVFWLRGMQYINLPPKAITWQEMYPMCAALVKAYKRMCPEKLRAAGAYVMRPEFLDHISVFLLRNVVLHYKGESMVGFWQLPVEDRLRIQAGGSGSSYHSHYRWNVSDRCRIRNHLYQRFAVDTGVRCAQVSQSPKKNKVVVSDFGELDYHIRNFCFEKTLTAAKNDGIVFRLLSQKSLQGDCHEVHCVGDTSVFDMTEYPDYGELTIRPFQALFWLMVWLGGSVFEKNPREWLVNFYCDCSLHSLLHQKTAIIPAYFAAAFMIDQWLLAGVDEDRIRKRTTAPSYSTVAYGNYDLLNFVYEATRSWSGWAVLTEYISSKKSLSVRGKIFTGFSFHSLRKLCATRAIEICRNAGFSAEARQAVCRRLRWVNLEMRRVYTEQNAKCRAEELKRSEHAATLHTSLTALARIHVHGKESTTTNVQIDGSLLDVVAVCKTGVSDVLSSFDKAIAVCCGGSRCGVTY